MASYLLTRSEGTIGELAHLLTDAAVAAIESGEEAINQRTLLLAPNAGPPAGAACSNASWHERGPAVATAPAARTAGVAFAGRLSGRLCHAK